MRCRVKMTRGVHSTTGSTNKHTRLGRLLVFATSMLGPSGTRTFGPYMTLLESVEIEIIMTLFKLRGEGLSQVTTQ